MTCDCCGHPAENWTVVDETRWTIACDACRDELEDADEAADRDDWRFHQDHDE